MFKFLKQRKDNRSAGFIGDLDTLNTLVTIVEDKGIICIYGPVGVGKTHLVTVAMKGRNWVEVTKPSDIGPQLEESDAHVIVDSQVIDRGIISGKKKLSRGATILIAQTLDKEMFCDCLKINPLTPAQMIEVGRKVHPKTDDLVLSRLAHESQGDMRVFLTSLKFPGERDIFQTPREWVVSMMCSDTLDPMTQLGRQQCEHGFVCDLVFSNILTGCKTIHPEIHDLIATADVFDSDPTWELINYLWVTGVYHPLMLMDRKVPEVAMKSGTSWTKFSNQKLREKRIRGTRLDRDTLMLLHQLQDPELFASYGITPAQVDVINNVSFNKIKTQAMKKQLVRLQSEGSRSASS